MTPPVYAFEDDWEDPPLLANGRSARGRLPAELAHPAFAEALTILDERLSSDLQPDDFSVASTLSQVKTLKP